MLIAGFLYQKGDKVIIRLLPTGDYFSPINGKIALSYNEPMRKLAQQEHVILRVDKEEYGYTYRLKDADWTWTNELLAPVDTERDNAYFLRLLERQEEPF